MGCGSCVLEFQEIPYVQITLIGIHDYSLNHTYISCCCWKWYIRC